MRHRLWLSTCARAWRGAFQKQRSLETQLWALELVQNLIIADNHLAGLAACMRAQELGYAAHMLTTYLEGEAREVGRACAALAKGLLIEQSWCPRPACLVLGGETTVTVKGKGKGGRNQELALAAALALEGWDNTMVISLATDGTDGPTDASGAVASGSTLQRAGQRGLDAANHLADNNAYPFFSALGDLIFTGPTNTNVNDLVFVLAF
jgi:hydroxypyruvate reductase